MPLTFPGGGSGLPFYSKKRWGPTPWGVYNFKARNPLKYYDLKMAPPNQSPEIYPKNLLTLKCQVLTPPKRIHEMKQQVEHVYKMRDPGNTVNFIYPKKPYIMLYVQIFTIYLGICVHHQGNERSEIQVRLIPSLSYCAWELGVAHLLTLYSICPTVAKAPSVSQEPKIWPTDI